MTLGLDAQEAEPGDRFGRYEILARLAAGGMGRVYLARARGPGGFEKTVALKTIHPELASRPNFVEMFLEEARIAARLDHPNVCRVSDFGVAEGVYFIAMEHLVGEPLSAVLAALDRAGAGPSAQTDAVLVRIVADAAEGLHAAHELVGDGGEPLELVHRDVSPHNIFVSYDGSVRIVDFGVASAGHKTKESGSELKGKLAYMAPEQVRRDPLDRRVDVWGLGVVLWEALAGADLWSAKSEVELLRAIERDPVTPLRRVRGDVAPELEAVVMRALEKRPERRWSSARELGQALSRWLVGRGEVVGLAEVAVLMAAAFPGGRTQKLAALDRVKLASADSPERALSGPRGRGSAPGREPALAPSRPPPPPRARASQPAGGGLAETFVGAYPASAPVGSAAAGTFVGSIDAVAAGPVARPMLGASAVGAGARLSAAHAPPMVYADALRSGEHDVVTGSGGHDAGAAAQGQDVRGAAALPFAPPPAAVVPEHEIVRHDARTAWRARAPWLAAAVVLAGAAGGAWWALGGSAPAEPEMVATPLAAVVVTAAPGATAPDTRASAPAFGAATPGPLTPAAGPTGAALPGGTVPGGPAPIVAPAGTPTSVAPAGTPAPPAPASASMTAATPIAPPAALAPAGAPSSGAPTAGAPTGPATATREGSAPPERTAAPERTTRERTTPARTTGTLAVTTDGGWAEVLVDGEAEGSTRAGALRVELPPGRHTVELRPFGLRAPGPGLSRSVDIEAGATRRVRVSLEE